MTIQEIKQKVNRDIVENYTGDITAESVNSILNETLDHVGGNETKLGDLALETEQLKNDMESLIGGDTTIDLTPSESSAIVGKYYNLNSGNVYEASAGAKRYPPIDLSQYIGKEVTIKFENYGNYSFGSAMCSSPNLPSPYVAPNRFYESNMTPDGIKLTPNSTYYYLFISCSQSASISVKIDGVVTQGEIQNIKDNIDAIETDVDSLETRVEALEKEDYIIANKELNVLAGQAVSSNDAYVNIEIEPGQEFTFVIKGKTASISGAYALNLFYADGTSVNPTNPQLNAIYNGIAKRKIVKIAGYISSSKVATSGTIEIEATTGKPAEKTKTYVVGVGGDYSTFTAMLRALKNDTEEKIVYVNGGTYDIFTEMGGETFINSITDPSSKNWTEVNDIVPPNTTIIGRGNVVLKWQPTAAQIKSQAMAFLFSPLNIQGNCHIENITIDCFNCRYGIHDETGSTFKNTRHEFVNVKVYHREETYGQKYAYGAGHTSNSIRVFKDCEFVAWYGNVWSTHDWADAVNQGSYFVFDNCLIYDPRSTDRTPCIFTSSDIVGRIDYVRFNNCYIPNKIGFLSGGSSRNYNQAYDVTLVGCNAITTTSSSNLENPIEVKQYLTR